MPWRVDKTGAKIAKGWEEKGKHKVAQEKWNTFMNSVNADQHPATAGGAMDYKLLNKATGQAQIKLSSSGERASFFVDEANKVVSGIQLGGHT